MNYLKVEGLTRSYGTLVFFEKINFIINKGDKVAVVAKNGSGKTTLLNSIAGIDPPEEGKIEFAKDIAPEYLLQNPDFNPDDTVMDAVFNSESVEVSIIKDYEKSIERSDYERMERLISEMDRLELWDYEARIKQILSVFKIDDTSQKTATLSGGQKKRLALANTLINEPDFLILDEPTNHLDLDMIEWLENYLTRSNSTLLMVTHDRYFLDRVCSNILEIDNRTIYSYSGNYSYFLEKREERIQNMISETEKARNLLRTEQEWMSRMPKARGTKAKYRVDRYYDLKDKAGNNYSDDNTEIDIQAERLGKKIIELKQVSKAFGDMKILQDFSYKFRRYEKVGIIGRNGSGKSTFLNVLTSVIDTDSGDVIYGQTIKIGYYKQTGINIEKGKKVIEFISDISDKIPGAEGSFLTAGAFLRKWGFDDSSHYVEVEKLSGGEKRRLYLMTVLMRNPNFLILDEPTNDLDIMTLNTLEEYLKSFNGCVIIVSHDRFFMDKVVDNLFVFRGDAVVENFPGNYSQFREAEKTREKFERSTFDKNKPGKKEKKTEDKKKKLSYNEKKEFKSLEKEIENLENEKSDIETALSSGNLNSEELTQKSERIAELLHLIDEKTDRWIELSEL